MPVDPAELAIVPGSAYTVGPKPNCGLRANLLNPEHYPVRAVCRHCGQPVEREKVEAANPDWKHAERETSDTI